MTATAGHTAPGPPGPGGRPDEVRVGPSVAWVDVDPALDPGAGDTVVLARIPEGPPMVLGGSAAAIWRAVLTHVRIVDVVAAVRATLADSPDDLADHILAFLGELHAAGVVVLSSRPPRP